MAKKKKKNNNNKSESTHQSRAEQEPVRASSTCGKFTRSSSFFQLLSLTETERRTKKKRKSEPKKGGVEGKEVR
jgi:hypothetical protein